MRTGEIPSIIIREPSNFKDNAIILSICHGIEEEGIPWEVIDAPESRCETLGHAAALQSRLSVGVGIGADGAVAIYHSQMKEDEPLIVKRKFDEKNTLKDIGVNAARLVKGIPFVNQR